MNIIRPRLNPKELMQHIKNTKGFDRILDKVKIVCLENGNGLAEFTVGEEHTNSMGKLHTGFVSMVTDFVSSFAFSSHELGNNYHVSIDMSLLFYKAETKIGDRIEVHAKTLRGGHSIAFLEVMLKNKSTGDILVKGNHNMFILHPHLLDNHSKKPLEKHGPLEVNDKEVDSAPKP